MTKDDMITFGGYKWRILDLKDDRALIITEEIIEKTMAARIKEGG